MTARPDTCSSRSRPRSVSIYLLCPTPSRPDGREGRVFLGSAHRTAARHRPQSGSLTVTALPSRKRNVVSSTLPWTLGSQPVLSLSGRTGMAPFKSADHATIRITGARSLGIDSSPHLQGECVRTTMRSASVRCRCKAPQFSCDRCSFPPPSARSRPEEETTQAVVRAQNGETLVTNHHRLAPLVPEGRSKHSLLVVGKQPNT